MTAPFWASRVSPRPPAAYSIYYECCMARQGRADTLIVFDGASHNAVASSDSIVAEIARERPAEGNEFNEIYHSHQDYLWDVRMARP